MKPKRKARGIVVWVALQIGDYDYSVFKERADAREHSDGNIGLLRSFLMDWCPAEAHRAGCPRLKPGEVKKVRVVIEEVTPKRARG